MTDAPAAIRRHIINAAYAVSDFWSETSPLRHALITPRVLVRDFFWPSRLGQYICERYTHHNAGPVWYNSYGWEPDMTCRRCGKGDLL